MLLPALESSLIFHLYIYKLPLEPSFQPHVENKTAIYNDMTITVVVIESEVESSVDTIFHARENFHSYSSLIRIKTLYCHANLN